MTRETDKTYNGWANYATWRVNLEMFDGYDPTDDFEMSRAETPAELARDLARVLQETATSVIEDGSREGVARDYAMAFLNGVDWDEIAEHLVEDYREMWPEHVLQYAAENA